MSVGTGSDQYTVDLRGHSQDRGGPNPQFPAEETNMTDPTPRPLRCAVYTRKSTEHNLDLAFTSLDAQREACEAYIRSQAGEGWRLVPEHYDDGGQIGRAHV